MDWISRFLETWVTWKLLDLVIMKSILNSQPLYPYVLLDTVPLIIFLKPSNSHTFLVYFYLYFLDLSFGCRSLEIFLISRYSFSCISLTWVILEMYSAFDVKITLLSSLQKKKTDENYCCSYFVSLSCIFPDHLAPKVLQEKGPRLVSRQIRADSPHKKKIRLCFFVNTFL